MRIRPLWCLAVIALAAGPVAAASPRDGGTSAQAGDDASLRKLSVGGRAATLPQAGTLVRALVLSGLIDTLREDGPFTVFAPTDEAFARLDPKAAEALFRPENRKELAALLKYHVVSGLLTAADVAGHSRLKTVAGGFLTAASNARGLGVNDATVVAADLKCRNGVIHVVDRVLTPPRSGVLATAKAAGQFGTLLAAVKAAGLESVLEGDGPFTVLAPTDEAFARIAPRDLKALLTPENRGKLAAILKYHVWPARVSARQAVADGEEKTLQGGSVAAKIVDGRLEIGGAKVLATDIDAGNGLIHVIDRVLTPAHP